MYSPYLESIYLFLPIIFCDFLNLSLIPPALVHKEPKQGTFIHAAVQSNEKQSKNRWLSLSRLSHRILQKVDTKTLKSLLCLDSDAIKTLICERARGGSPKFECVALLIKQCFCFEFGRLPVGSRQVRSLFEAVVHIRSIAIFAIEECGYSARSFDPLPCDWVMAIGVWLGL